MKSEAITKLVCDQELRQRALDRVKSSDFYDPEATYWQDTLQLLGLDP